MSIVWCVYCLYAAPEDYTVSAMTITFTAGETWRDVIVTIVDDSVGEGSESFTVTLANPSSGLILGTGSAVATIEISADEVTVEFSPTSYTVSEGDTAVTLTVVLTGDIPTSDVTVEVMTMDGSATGNCR